MRQLNPGSGRARFGVTYQLALFVLLVFLIVLFGILQPVFFSPDVLFNVTAIIGEIGIMALAMTFIITTGGIDLSVGYTLQLSAIVFGSVYAADAQRRRRRRPGGRSRAPPADS